MMKSWFAKLSGRRTTIGLGLIAVLAAFFRIYELRDLPPGLSAGEAAIGLSALNLIDHGALPHFNAASAYAPLWVALQAIPVWLMGHTALALRIMPAIFGVFAVWTTWLWAKDWFGSRVGWIAAVLMAVTPWAVTMSRTGGPAILAVALLPLMLWAGGRALSREKASYWWLTATLFVVCWLIGPLGWTINLTVIILGLTAAWRLRRELLVRTRLGALILMLLSVLAVVAAAIVEHVRVHELLQQSIVTGKIDALSVTAGKVLGMFNIHGDDNFLHNFNGQPMLNAFVGLMFIAGLLVAITRFAKRRYQSLIVITIVALVPAFASSLGAPNAFHAALVLPVALVLAAIGISYMLELWHTTFPINSAARSTGMAAILLLLLLTVFQGYVQIFRAWSGSAETYTAYNEAAARVADAINATHGTVAKYAAGRYVVAGTDEQTVVSYLTDSDAYRPLSAAGIASLPEAKGTRQFYITAPARDMAAHNLALKFPGGKLVPNLSDFSQNELYYTYEITQ